MRLLQVLFATTVCVWTLYAWTPSRQSWAQEASTLDASWIWHGDVGQFDQIKVRYGFDAPQSIKSARLIVTCDNECTVFINDQRILRDNSWESLEIADVSDVLKPGKNVIAIDARNQGGIAGLMAVLNITDDAGKDHQFATGNTWRASTDSGREWRTTNFDDANWKPARVIGRLGDRTLAWTTAISNADVKNALASSGTGEFLPRLAEHAQVPNGFKIEQIYQVPRTMGSWVSLAVDPQGRLIASDQQNAGLFLVTPGRESQPTIVEKLPLKISSAQGLLWAFDSLYIVVNGGPEAGLHRARDTDGDGKVDSSELLMHVPGGGEHGPHGVTLSPDGKSLFVASGNHTKLPQSIAGSYLPQNWSEDHILPRRWDANGHAAGILAPGGWICEVDPSGKQWRVFTIGYRNQYDMAFNADGEMFTYDSDMEWDLGSPWYRPTRVCHATSGSEFGWRSGTGKWPVYYEDSLPPAINIGPGSPTGVVFGTGAKFPAKYQKALYILDWTYSTIYAIHLKPQGASYVGEKEDFVTGSPLPVTDAVIGHDGAMYFAVGGRGAQSALYRVTYTGTAATSPINGHDAEGADLRALRRRLEAFHGTPSGDLELIWKNLSHEDRFIRYAARVALEFIPTEKWRSRAIAESNPQAHMNAMIALAHQGKRDDQDAMLGALARLDYASMDDAERLTWLRAHQLIFTRLGQPASETRIKLLKRLEGLYPAKGDNENAELVQLLVYLGSESVVSTTLTLMEKLGPEAVPDWGYLVQRNAGYGSTVGKLLANMPPLRGIHFAFVLRNAKVGWTLELRKKYFEFFLRAAAHPGGNSYAKFLMQFREDALESCTSAEKIVLGELAGRSLLTAPVAATPPKGPGRKWDAPQALAVLNREPLANRSFEAGRNLFHATACAKCHRLGGEGGAIGPDLSTAGKKFPLPDLMDALLDPSKVIADQYGSHQVLAADGKVIIGRAVEIGDEVHIYTPDADAKPIVLKKGQIEEMKPSKVSQMPANLLDTLNEEELKDIIAYLLSAANPRDKLYAK